MTAALARDYGEGGPPDFPRALRVLLRELAETARAQSAWLLDRNGQLLASAGPELDSTSLAGLLARRVREGDQARLLLGAGLSLSGSGARAIYLRVLAGRALAVLCFEGDGVAAEAAVASERASERFARLQEEAARAAFASFEALSKEDLEFLLAE